MGGTISAAAEPGELEGPSGLCSPGHLAALQGQLLIALDASVSSTKHLASFSVNLYTRCSCSPVSLRFIRKREDRCRYFVLQRSIWLLLRAEFSRSWEALDSQTHRKNGAQFSHEMMTYCLYPWLYLNLMALNLMASPQDTSLDP